MGRKTRAVCFILLAAFGFAGMNVFVRLAGDLPVMQKGFFRNLVALAVSAAIALRHGKGLRWKKGDLPMLLVRAVFGTLGIWCNFYAVDHMLLADANILNKLSPFFAILFSLLLLKERVKPVQAAAVCAAFGGALLVIKPGFSSAALPALIGAAGGCCAGLAYTAVRVLSGRGEESERIVFFFSAFSCLSSVPALLVDYHPMTPGQLLCLLGAGAFATLGQFGVTLAYANAPAREISVFDYSQVLFSAALGFFIFGQCPDALSVLGYLVIVGVSAGMFLHDRRGDAAEREKTRKGLEK